jgi:large subunit ribosomal protein L25
MKTILLKGEKRADVGTKDAKALRNEGKVPCVLYGKDTQQHFAVYREDFKNLVYTPNTYKVKLDIEGTEYDAIMQDIQFHPVSEVIIHADFLLIQPEKPITIKIPLNVKGTAPGVRAGGKLMKKFDKLTVKGLIKDIPEFILADISKLELGQSIKVKELAVKGIDILDAPENAVLSVKMTRASIAAAAATPVDEKKK